MRSKLKPLDTFSLLLTIFSVLLKVILVNAETTVYYGGNDDRMDYYQLPTSTNQTVKDYAQYYQDLATSVCLITFEKATAASNTSGKSKLYLTETLAEKYSQGSDGSYYPACDNMSFKTEYVVAGAGTGTLIDDNKVLTADHVFQDYIKIGPLVCIFNYFKKSATCDGLDFLDRKEAFLNWIPKYFLISQGVQHDKEES